MIGPHWRKRRPDVAARTPLAAVLVGVVFLIMTLPGCGGPPKSKTSATSPPSATASGPAPYHVDLHEQKTNSDTVEDHTYGFTIPQFKLGATVPGLDNLPGLSGNAKKYVYVTFSLSSEDGAGATVPVPFFYFAVPEEWQGSCAYLAAQDDGEFGGRPVGNWCITGSDATKEPNTFCTLKEGGTIGTALTEVTCALTYSPALANGLHPDFFRFFIGLPNHYDSNNQKTCIGAFSKASESTSCPTLTG